jgi:hypothetical protein
MNITSVKSNDDVEKERNNFQIIIHGVKEGGAKTPRRKHFSSNLLTGCLSPVNLIEKEKGTKIENLGMLSDIQEFDKNNNNLVSKSSTSLNWAASIMSCSPRTNMNSENPRHSNVFDFTKKFNNLLDVTKDQNRNS